MGRSSSDLPLLTPLPCRPARMPHVQGPAAAESASVSRLPTSAGDSAAYQRRNVSLDDVVIVSAVRTALCKAKRGGFKDTPVDDLIAAVLKETIARTGVEPEASTGGLTQAAAVLC